jgi:hypothetical protein
MWESADFHLACLAVAAALVSIPVAWRLTKNHDSTKPNWAVRLIATFGRYPRFGRFRDYLGNRRDFPRREAFLATFILIFDAIFVGGILLGRAFAPLAK